MVKFEGESDPDYQVLSSKIVLMGHAAQRIAKGWVTPKRIHVCSTVVIVLTAIAHSRDP